MKNIVSSIYKTRYFWSHLAKCDLKSRFRRSKLGLIWVVLQPFLLTIIMAVVFSTIFNEPLGNYILYILSGIVVWNVLNSGIIAGGYCFMNSEQYIRQFNHPIIIYSLRYAVLNIVTFLIELIALIIWVIFYSPIYLIFAIITLPLTLVIYFVLSWALCTIAGYSNAKYRDYPQVMSLIMQTIWYLSPVFFKKEMFMRNHALELFMKYNPITHILNLVREPFIYGSMPSAFSYIYSIIFVLVVVFFAYRINKRNSKKIIFYL